MKIDEYFLEDKDKIYYIELKNPNLLEEQVPLPILQDDFAENIQTGTFEEEVSVEYFIRGILFNLAVDPDFLYKKEYKDFLERVFKNPEEDLFYFALSFLDERYALHFFRGLVKLDYKNLNMKFFYSWLLYQRMDEDLTTELLAFYNNMIRENPKYPLSYFGLGLLEKDLLNFTKAKLYFQESKKYLENSKLEKEINENFLSILEDEIKTIEKDVSLQEGAQLLNQGKIAEALEIFQKLDHTSSGIVKYFIGKAHLMRKEDEKALEYFKLAKDLDFKDISLFLDYSYLLSLYGEEDMALEILDEGLDLYKEEENLLYNRAQLYLILEEKEKAIEDFRTILSYEDVSEEMYSSVVDILTELKVI